MANPKLEVHDGELYIGARQQYRDLDRPGRNPAATFVGGIRMEVGQLRNGVLGEGTCNTPFGKSFGDYERRKFREFSQRISPEWWTEFDRVCEELLSSGEDSEGAEYLLALGSRLKTWVQIIWKDFDDFARDASTDVENRTKVERMRRTARRNGRLGGVPARTDHDGIIRWILRDASRREIRSKFDLGSDSPIKSCEQKIENATASIKNRVPIPDIAAALNLDKSTVRAIKRYRS